jgi:hypothetical protein
MTADNGFPPGHNGGHRPSLQKKEGTAAGDSGNRVTPADSSGGDPPSDTAHLAKTPLGNVR